VADVLVCLDRTLIKLISFAFLEHGKREKGVIGIGLIEN